MKDYKELPPSVRDSLLQFYRNGRWGTCGGCPRDIDGHCYPEFCGYTDRYDHHLTLDGLVQTLKNYLKDDKE